MATFTGAAVSHSRKGGGLARREAITFYLLISPWLLGLLLFVVGPMIVSLSHQFHAMGPAQPGQVHRAEKL